MADYRNKDNCACNGNDHKGEHSRSDHSRSDHSKSRSDSKREHSDRSKSDCSDESDVCKLAQKRFDFANFINYTTQDNLYWARVVVGNTITALPGVQVFYDGVGPASSAFQQALTALGLFPMAPYYRAGTPTSLGTYIAWLIIDPCVDLCALLALNPGTNFYRALRTPTAGNLQVPVVKSLNFICPSQFSDILDYIVEKINSLCIPECVKTKIVDSLIEKANCLQLQNATTSCSSIDNVGNAVLDGSICSIKSSLPKCGPFYVPNIVNSPILCPESCGSSGIAIQVGEITQSIILQVLLAARYILKLNFSLKCKCREQHERDCECDLSFEKVCKIVFGRLCIINVTSDPCCSPDKTKSGDGGKLVGRESAGPQ